MIDTFIMTLVFTILGFLSVAFILFAILALSCLSSITLICGLIWLEDLVIKYFQRNDSEKLNIFGKLLFVILRIIHTLCYCIPFVVLVILIWKGISFPLF